MYPDPATAAVVADTARQAHPGNGLVLLACLALALAALALTGYGTAHPGHTGPAVDTDPGTDPAPTPTTRRPGWHPDLDAGTLRWHDATGPTNRLARWHD